MLWARLVPGSQRGSPPALLLLQQPPSPAMLPADFFAVSSAPRLRLLCFETIFVYLTSYFSKTVPKPIENCIYTQEEPSQPTACPPSLAHLHLYSQLSPSDQLHMSLEATAPHQASSPKEMLVWRRGELWRKGQPPSHQAHQLGSAEDPLCPEPLSPAIGLCDCSWKCCSGPLLCR